MTQISVMSTRRASVGIIGAGFSGISHAYFLKELGISSIVIDKASRIGGKCLSVKYGGLAHELGVCYSALHYKMVDKLIKSFKLKTFKITKNVISKKGAKGERPLIFKYYINQNGLIKTLYRLIKYFIIRKIQLRKFTKGDSNVTEILSLCFSDWLKKYDLSSLELIFNRTTSALGYGRLDTIPALYAIRWNTPSLLMTGVLKKIKMIDVGFSDLLLKLSEKVSIELQNPIDFVSYNKENNTWQIMTEKGEYIFNHLVIACNPLDIELEAFMSKEDADLLYSGLSQNKYSSSLVRVKNWFKIENTRFYPDSYHRLGSMQVARKSDKIEVSELRRANDVCMYVCYQYVHDIPPAELRAILKENIEDDEGELEDIVEQKFWMNFFPHFTSAGIRNGCLKHFESLQGQRNVWYCNAAIAFESINHLVNLSHSIANSIANIVVKDNSAE